MSEYGWIDQVIKNKLSNRSLMLISRFTRLVKQVNGKVINLQDPLLAKKIVMEAQISNDSRIKELFEDMLLEFHSLKQG